MPIEPSELHDFDVYQKQALTTFLRTDKPQVENILYCTLGLCGEAGEVAEKVKKVIRDKGGTFDDVTKLEIIKEVGDILWYAAVLAHVLGFSLYGVALQNVMKLASRKARNALSGDGDNR